MFEPSFGAFLKCRIAGKIQTIRKQPSTRDREKIRREDRDSKPEKSPYPRSTAVSLRNCLGIAVYHGAVPVSLNIHIRADGVAVGAQRRDLWIPENGISAHVGHILDCLEHCRAPHLWVVDRADRFLEISHLQHGVGRVAFCVLWNRD